MKTDALIQIRDKVITVKGEITDENERYSNGVGYKKDGQVWIFTSDSSHIKDNYLPYFWKEISANGKILAFSNPSKDVLDSAKIENCWTEDEEDIINSTSDNEIFYNEEELNDLNSSAKVLVPIINDTDDFLKKLIKTAIIEKGVDINKVKSKVSKVYDLYNMKSALMGPTKMSPTYFIRWCEILGLDFEVTIRDNKTDVIDPLKNEHTYLSWRDSVIQNYKEKQNEGKSPE